MLFDFFLEHVGDGLVSWWVEVVRQSDFFVLCQIWIMVDWWVEIKEYWKVNWLIWIQKLILEAEALDFVEVESTFFGKNLVNGNASYRLVRAIVHLIECEGSLASIDQELSRLGLEFPRDLILSMAHEANPPLTEHIYFLRCHSIVLCMLWHSEAKCLTDYVIKGHSQEVATEEKQTEPIDTIEFTPLSLLFE